jgi:predicted phosphate transport protein (TIGR00153 family)
MLNLKPKENEFYSLLKESAGKICESAAVLKTAVADPLCFQEKMAELNEIEHAADEITKSIIIKLNKTLVTPMDREDIYSLATILDDIVDYIQGALERMIMYKAAKATPGVQDLVGILQECSLLIKVSFEYLPDTRTKIKDILENTEQIHCLESEGDRLYRLEVAKLFDEETNPIEIIKWKEILEHLEDAIDRCEDLSDSLKGVVLKYA